MPHVRPQPVQGSLQKPGGVRGLWKQWELEDAGDSGMGKAGPGPPGQGLPRPRPWKLLQSSNLIPYNAVQGEKELLLLSVPPGTSQVWTQEPLAWRPLFATPAALTGSDPALPVLSRGTQPSLARESGLPRVSPQLPCCPWNSRQDSHRESTHPSQQPDPCCSPPAPARATLAPYALQRGHVVSDSWLCSAAPQPGEPPRSTSRQEANPICPSSTSSKAARTPLKQAHLLPAAPRTESCGQMVCALGKQEIRGGKDPSQSCRTGEVDMPSETEHSGLGLGFLEGDSSWRRWGCDFTVVLSDTSIPPHPASGHWVAAGG